MKGLRIEAVIMDMDGLVLDTESGYAEAWRQAAAAMGYELDQTFLLSLSGLNGNGVRQAITERLGGGFAIDEFKQLSADCWRLWVREHGIPVKFGFAAFMAVIDRHGLPFCLATNSRRRDALHCLELAGLAGVFPLIIARDDVEHPKPSADMLLKAALQMGTAMAHCLVLEDSPTGLAAAHAAGAPCLYIPSSSHTDERLAGNALATLTDLAESAEFLAECLRAPRIHENSI